MRQEASCSMSVPRSRRLSWLPAITKWYIGDGGFGLGSNGIGGRRYNELEEQCAKSPPRRRADVETRTGRLRPLLVPCVQHGG
jgi:hypothetical protein